MSSVATPEQESKRRKEEPESESDEEADPRDQVKMKDHEYTDRGFSYVQFEDHYKQQCSIQQSSVYTHIWLGVDKDWQGKEIFGRMHLSMEQVQALLPYLERFAKTGSMEPEEE
jgi:hypothetical protein